MFRWEYTAGMREEITSYKEVVKDLPGGGHGSRTPLVKKEGNDIWLYITIGSAGNVDENYSRSNMMRYNVTDTTKEVLPFLILFLLTILLKSKTIVFNERRRNDFLW